MQQEVPSRFGDFYRRALQTNEHGNNRGQAHNRSQRYGRSFQRPATPPPPARCALDNPDHAGEVEWCRYIDGAGHRWFQRLCQGHRGRHWRPLDAATVATLTYWQRRMFTPEPPPSPYSSRGR